MSSSATVIVRDALAGTGVELVGSCRIEGYDAAAPEALRSASLMPGARGLVVAGSVGPALWRLFCAHLDASSAPPDTPHPYDAFVATLLDRADDALARAGVPFRRFEAAFHFTPRVSFIALARLAGLGSPGPFGLLVHETYGVWWALRGAWLVDADVDPPRAQRFPCDGCAAPCVGGRENAGGIAAATPEVRSRCVVGQEWRYDDDQLAFHYDRSKRPI